MVARIFLNGRPMRDTEQNLPKTLPGSPTPKAAPLIVTIYGDIVEPRGGTLWIGDLITLCGQFGVNESLVRTAVSRLVSRDQLRGGREGRRSYYSLTDGARAGFRLAAERIFGVRDSDCDLLILVQPDRAEHERLLADGFGQIADTVFLGPDRPGRTGSGARLRAIAGQGRDPEIRSLLCQAFDLEGLSQAYSGFIAQYVPVIGGGPARLSGLNGLEALIIRLAMVHAFRTIRLRDPQLPPSVLPDDWPGHIARDLFAGTYLDLSEISDSFIGATFKGRGGALPVHTKAVNQRLATLRQNR